MLQSELSVDDQLLIERGFVKLLRADIARLSEALKFYANHIHWMQQTENSEFNNVLIAAKFWDMNGWAVAEKALNPRDLPKPGYKSEYLDNISPNVADPDVP